MKKRYMLLTAVLILGPATASAQPKPDLTVVESTWRIKPRSVLVTIANAGAATAGKSTGGYGCKTAPNAKGISVGTAAQFFVPSLTPKQKFKIFLDCGNGWRITSVGLDAGNKVDESDENNNIIFLEDVQQKKGPAQKPGMAAQKVFPAVDVKKNATQTRQNIARGDEAGSSGRSWRRKIWLAHARMPAEQYYNCPQDLPAQVTAAPGDWQVMPLADKFRLGFDSVDADRLNGKHRILCSYKAAGAGVIIFQDVPASYVCSRTVKPRQIRCGTVIKVPGK